MLLGLVLLTPRATPVLAGAAAYWAHRERVEVEAASVFADLAALLDGDARSSRASTEASRDELRHADACRALVERFAPGEHAPVARARVSIHLAPRDVRDRGLYGAVALGCVTESLSVALLMEIRERTTDAQVAETAHAILKDEVRHSRFGWAALAAAHARGDVSWLAAHVPAMIAGATGEESAGPLLRGVLPAGALEGHGVLSADVAHATCQRALAEVVVPGLAHFGLHVDSGPPEPQGRAAVRVD